MLDLDKYFILGVIDYQGTVESIVVSHEEFKKNYVSHETEFMHGRFKSWRFYGKNGYIEKSYCSDRLTAEDYYLIEKHLNDNYNVNKWLSEKYCLKKENEYQLN